MSTFPPEDEDRTPRPERDWDAEFAAITAHLDDVTADSQTDQPVRWGAPTSPEPRREQGQPAPEPVPEPATAAADEHEDGPADAPEADDDFVPPEPRPLPTDDPATTIMIGALVVGPLWLIGLTVFDREAAGLWWAFAGMVTVLGLALAVARQPKSRDTDDPDDGARL